MSGRALLYGATGYTGRLIAGRLAAEGVDVVLAGRDGGRVREVAEPLGLAWAAFELSDPDEIARMLGGVDVVLHAAGPFEKTAAPMLQACLAAGAHYLDLGGEWPVFVDLMARGADAKAAGIMVMPGVGLTIVATDCLLALAKQAQPDAVKLRLGVSRPEVVTRGTLVSAAHLMSPDVVVRRGGRLVSFPAGQLTHAFDFGEGLVETVALSWADVATGELTTGVGDIEVYSELGWIQRLSYRVSGMAMSVTGAAPWRTAGGLLGSAWPEGPSEASRRRAEFVMVCEAVDPWRRTTRVRMRTQDGYTVSELTAAAAVRRVLAGRWAAGFQTPARVFGADFILGLGCAELDAASEALVGALA
jgi:short subunit dehydrogenase-like uncharacterized protein